MIRDRIKSLRRVKAKELVPHPNNWREHPETQRAAMQAAFKEIGLADACLAREDENGTLHLIDGHLRADLNPEQKLPVLVLDVSEEEADKLLVTLDPLVHLATANLDKLAAFDIEFDHEELRNVFDGIAQQSSISEPDVEGFADVDEFADNDPMVMIKLTEELARSTAFKASLNEFCERWGVESYKFR